MTTIETAHPTTTSTDGRPPKLEQFSYDDGIVRLFLGAMLLWAAVGMLVGILVAVQLALPAANFLTPWLSFGRLRPLHTNAVIFAFTGCGLFAGIYYSMQRLLKARLFSDTLSKIHFWMWQLIIVSAALSLPLGFTTSKEYAELEWPIDIAITLCWVVFAVNFFGTIWKRRERHIYVSIWFYISTVITIAILHIANSMEVPAGWLKSYSLYAGVQDAFMQWWYGHNAVAFFLTTPILGIMYYFMPKAADRPVFSYRLSILHFWSLIFIYIWAGPHHLHYTALPAWASTLGMLFSVMLWMPSWGGMVNGLLTLRGAWNKVAEDPILKFFVVAVTFYGMSTFEGPMLSIKAVNSLSHYTDWTIAHVHAGALGWVGFMMFGMAYWLAPRLYQTKGLWSKKLAETHFWIGTVGILLYIVPIYAAGLTQGLMWRGFDDTGRLMYPDFVQTTLKLMPMYWARIVGGTLYLGGALLCIVNVFMTWKARPKTYEVPVFSAPALAKGFVEPQPAPSYLRSTGAHVADFGYTLERWIKADWHRAWEGKTLKFSIWAGVAVIVASLFEIVPLFTAHPDAEDKAAAVEKIKNFDPKIDVNKIAWSATPIALVEPYTALELAGRDIYQAEGCYNCHSQMVRPIRSETIRYGEYSKAGEFVYDHPFQWGSRRIGPDLARVGSKYPNLWHVRHMQDPRAVTLGSIMPGYPWLLKDDLDWASIAPHMKAMKTLGVPYTDADIAGGEKAAHQQAAAIAADVVKNGGPPHLENKKIMALIAYLQRLGKFKQPPPAPPAPPATAAPAATAPAAPAPATPAPAAPVAAAAPAPAGH